MKTLELSVSRYQALLLTDNSNVVAQAIVNGDTWYYMGERVRMVPRCVAVQLEIDRWRAEWDNACFDATGRLP